MAHIGTASKPVLSAANSSKRNMQRITEEEPTIPNAATSQSQNFPAPRSPLGADGVSRPQVSAPVPINPRNFPKAGTLKETRLAQQAAIRRANTQARPSSTGHTSTASEPVLVLPSPNSPNMKTKKKSPPSPANTNTPNLPSPNDFSFEEILNSIGPEAHEAIDAIAEICGRSKLSLANQHANHLPPQGEVDTTSLAGRRSRTSTTERVQTRSMARNLTNTRAGETVSVKATAVTSPVISHVHTPRMSSSPRETNPNAALIPQVLAWLRGSESENENHDKDGAAPFLHRLLHEADAART